MVFRLSIVLFLFALAAAAGENEELAQAAKSPYGIARFVDTHIRFEWEPLWKGLGISDVFLPSCGDGGRKDCTAEMVTILDPFQVILILHHEASMFEVYLRFLRPSGPDSSGAWKFGGYHNPFVKYFPPRHRTLRLGKKQFFLVTGQGAAGSGISSEIEDWMDLSLPKFEPVLSVTTKADYFSWPGGVGLEIDAFTLFPEAELGETIKVYYTARFSFNGGQLSVSKSDRVTYVRSGEKFVVDASRSTRPKADIENLYGGDIPDYSDYPRYLFTEFKKIATGPSDELKDWLKRFLKSCEDTRQKRELLALLR
jgi:hypothetical protein